MTATHQSAEGVQLVEKKRGLRFDPTINAGHVMSALTMLVAGFLAYSSLASRVSILEERSTTQNVRSGERAQEQKEAIADMRAEIKEVRRSVDDLTRILTGVKR